MTVLHSVPVRQAGPSNCCILTAWHSESEARNCSSVFLQTYWCRVNGDQEWLGQLQAIFNCRNYAMPKTTLYVLVRWHVMTPQVLAGAEMAVSKWEGEEGLPASYPVILASSVL